jgi:hypothetical protein
MNLYVCYGTFKSRKAGGHPCRTAYEALVDAGHEPEVVKTYGCFRTDPVFPGRRKIKRLTGTYQVPTLELDDGSLIDGTDNIVSWAKANAQGVASPSGQGSSKQGARADS